MGCPCFVVSGLLDAYWWTARLMDRLPQRCDRLRYIAGSAAADPVRIALPQLS